MLKPQVYIFLLVITLFLIRPSSAQRISINGLLSIPFTGASYVSTTKDYLFPKYSYRTFIIEDKKQFNYGWKNFEFGLGLDIDYRRLTLSIAAGWTIRENQFIVQYPIGNNSFASYKGQISQNGPFVPLRLRYVYFYNQKIRLNVNAGLSYLYMIFVDEWESKKTDASLNRFNIFEGMLYDDNKHMLGLSVGTGISYNFSDFSVTFGPKYEWMIYHTGRPNTNISYLYISCDITAPIFKKLKGHDIYINKE